jgi:CspA family cold shock protein
MGERAPTATRLPDQANNILGRIRSISQQGTVKFFNAERGYGFIKPEDGGRDIFVHISAVERAGLNSLNEGQRVTFEIEADKKGNGPKAVDLHLL